ncbi:MAG: hypothetical protein PVH61_19040 [Candidatus Aminicenantes bacterium]|jgi:hypothetical protein
MEIITTVKDFPEKIRSHHIPPETCIRVIIDNHDTEPNHTIEDSLSVPTMKPEEQRRLLDFIPGEYQPGASEELIKIIEESRTNTESLSLD